MVGTYVRKNRLAQRSESKFVLEQQPVVLVASEKGG